jgi:hypothetical protein
MTQRVLAHPATVSGLKTDPSTCGEEEGLIWTHRQIQAAENSEKKRVWWLKTSHSLMGEEFLSSEYHRRNSAYSLYLALYLNSRSCFLVVCVGCLVRLRTSNPSYPNYLCSTASPHTQELSLWVGSENTETPGTAFSSVLVLTTSPPQGYEDVCGVLLPGRTQSLKSRPSE